MNRRIVYKQEAKCNFCYNWFQVFSEIKFGLNICEACIYKALNTSCFKLPTPQGHLYQVYLARRNIAVNPSHQLPLLQKIDEYMHSQIRQLLQKWQQITKLLKTGGAQQLQDEIWKKTEFILKHDAKTFATLNSQSIEQIREDVIGREKTDRKLPCTPLKDKSINMSIKYLNKSSKKNMNRMDSKKSLRSFRDLTDKSAGKIAVELEGNDEQSRRPDTSPFNGVKKSTSSRNLNPQNTQTRQFLTKMQALKSSIALHLEQSHPPPQTPLAQPLNILKQRIYETIQNTNCINKCIELVSYPPGLHGIDMRCYLGNLEWEGVEVVKFVKVGLTDQQLGEILEFIRDKNVETLVLTSNNLTQESCRNILKADVKNLRNIYLGKNQVFSYKAKNQIKQLKSKYNFFL